MNTQIDIVLQTMKRFCAARERSHSEVRTKLIKSKVYGDLLEEIMGTLIEEGFLNEERFAKSYVRGKFNQNQWGRIKIKQGLGIHKLSPYVLKKAFEEIEEEEYHEMIRKLWNKKFDQVREENLFAKKNKIYRYLLSKGFESHEIKKVIHELSR